MGVPTAFIGSAKVNSPRTAAPPNSRCHATEHRIGYTDAGASSNKPKLASFSLPARQISQTTAKMSNALRLVRNGPSRTASSSSQWACFFCQHARPQSSRPNFAEFRRKFSNSRPRREQQIPHQPRQNATYAPSMDRVREQYSQRNKTIAYGDHFWAAIRGILGSCLSIASIP